MIALKAGGLEGISRTSVAELTDKHADIYVPAHNFSFSAELSGIYSVAADIVPKSRFLRFLQ
jgi:hypothetical protein